MALDAAFRGQLAATMIAVLITLACWTPLVVLGARLARAWIGAERAQADATARERARRDELGLHWTELCVAGDPVMLVEREGERMVARDVTLVTRWGAKTPVALRGGVPVLAPERFVEPTAEHANVYVLARWPAQPETYRESAAPITLEPDPERGYVLSDTKPDAAELRPHGWAAYLPFFAGALLLVALSFVPWVRGVVVIVSVAWALGEIAMLARARPPLTSIALSVSWSAYGALMRAREERRREREADFD